MQTFALAGHPIGTHVRASIVSTATGTDFGKRNGHETRIDRCDIAIAPLAPRSLDRTVPAREQNMLIIILGTVLGLLMVALVIYARSKTSGSATNALIEFFRRRHSRK